MEHLKKSIVGTRSGAAIAVYEGGSGVPVFAIGGMSATSFSASGAASILERVARKGAVRCVLMDLAAYGQSTAAGPGLTMDLWLQDIEEVFMARVGEPALWTGSSIGAWLMVLVHARRPEWFQAMCALAPAFDWDQQYAAPALRDGRVKATARGISNEGKTIAAPATLLISMPAHHVLGKTTTLTAPMHVIFGARDDVAPASATRHFIQSARGAPCTGELLAEGDHGIAKLDTPLPFHRYRHWLDTHVAAAQKVSQARAAPEGPGPAP